MHDPRLSHLIDCEFSPVILLPTGVKGYKLLDLSSPTSNKNDESKNNMVPWTIGRYNEVRKNMYTTSLFGGVRNIHVGIDLGAPVNTPVMSFAEGTVHSCGYNEAALDYGYVVILHYQLESVNLWANHVGKVPKFQAIPLLHIPRQNLLDKSCSDSP